MKEQQKADQGQHKIVHLSDLHYDGRNLGILT